MQKFKLKNSILKETKRQRIIDKGICKVRKTFPNIDSLTSKVNQEITECVCQFVLDELVKLPENVNEELVNEELVSEIMSRALKLSPVELQEVSRQQTYIFANDIVKPTKYICKTLSNIKSFFSKETDYIVTTPPIQGTNPMEI
jgi:hypothetical protein